jgi:hypothetical protein
MAETITIRPHRNEDDVFEIIPDFIALSVVICQGTNRNESLSERRAKLFVVKQLICGASVQNYTL